VQHTATQCSTLQHTATRCNTRSPSQNAPLIVFKVLTRGLFERPSFFQKAFHFSKSDHDNVCGSNVLIRGSWGFQNPPYSQLPPLPKQISHCNTLRHTVTQCNTLQHTATHCNTLQHTATHCNTLQHTATHRNTLQHTATHCNTLSHDAPQPVPSTDMNFATYNSLEKTSTQSTTHTATRCNTLQHTATHCNTLQHQKIHTNLQNSTPSPTYIHMCPRGWANFEKPNKKTFPYTHI